MNQYNMKTYSRRLNVISDDFSNNYFGARCLGCLLETSLVRELFEGFWYATDAYDLAVCSWIR